MNNSAAQANCNRLRTIICSYLVNVVLYVDLYRFFSNEKLLRYVFVSISTGNLSQNFYFPRREFLFAHVLCESCCHLRRNAFFPSINLADRFHQFLWRRALQKIGAGTGFECSLDLHIAFESCQHDETCFREFGAQCEHGIYSAFVRKSKIHKSDIRLELGKLRYGLFRAGSLSNHLHVWLTVDDRGKALAQQRMIIHAEYTNSSRFRHEAHSLSVRAARLRILPKRICVRRRHQFSEDGNSKAILPGTESSTSVPAVALLRTLSLAPILSLLSFIPDKPQ